MQTSDSKVELLAARIERLEQQNRRLKRGGLALLLAAACTVLMGQARPNTAVDAQRYTLRDARGAKRAELALDSESPQSNPDPTLRFFDDKGNQTLTLAATRLELAGQSEMGSNILLDDSKGVARADLGILGEQSFVLLNDSKGTPRIRVELDHDQPKIVLQDPQENPHLGLALVNGEPVVGLDGTDGTSTAIGATDVVTNGRPRQTSAASIILFGKDGSVLWSAPGTHP
jgi:hypothetical protein